MPIRYLSDYYLHERHYKGDPLEIELTMSLSLERVEIELTMSLSLERVEIELTMSLSLWRK